MTKQQFGYDSMGTKWNMHVWDTLDPAVFAAIRKEIIAQSEQFDRTYSRFIKSSLIWELTRKTGVVEVPEDLTAMLRLYEKLHDLSGGKCNPLVGNTLSDLGYDAEYSLKAKPEVRPVPDFHDALRIVDDTHIELKQSVLIDVGALGKGYFVDKLAAYLKRQGVRRFLVDGSGDIYYQGDGQSIRVGLEHPGDTTKAIGVVTLGNGGMCGSSGNRRFWEGRNHILDPDSLTSPAEIVATWVIAPTAAAADGLATCLFFVAPEQFERDFRFEYCIVNREYKLKRSAGFAAELL
ncbi:MAG TPA: FAD:protein FMN transferase [Candidatus Peribacteria bacterium]|nr:FAD:protein FMN transferase [Candidatus Peribacteria bacterium]